MEANEGTTHEGRTDHGEQRDSSAGGPTDVIDILATAILTLLIERRTPPADAPTPHHSEGSHA